MVEKLLLLDVVIIDLLHHITDWPRQAEIIMIIVINDDDDNGSTLGSRVIKEYLNSSK